MRTPALALCTLLALPALGAPSTVLRIEASADATLIEDPDGLLANGAGPALFVGRTNQSADSVRRALLRFEMPPLPALGRRPVVVERVELVLHANFGNPAPSELRVHAVLAPWTEGPAFSGGGSGAPSGPGDATWLHASFPDAFWLHNGAQLDGRPLASVEVGDAGEVRVSSPELTRLLAGWVARPGENFGLVLIGDETHRQTVKSIASREHADPAVRPAIEITFR
jgi:hypothetical protein